MDTINVIFSCNDNYAKYYAVLQTSLYEAHPNRDVHIYFLHSQVTKENIDLMKRIAEKYKKGFTEIYVNPEMFSHISFHKLRLNHFCAEMFYWYAAPELLPKTVDRAIYLDADTLCFKDISEFYDLDFKDKLIISYAEEKPEYLKKFESASKKDKIIMTGKAFMANTFFCTTSFILNIKDLRNDNFNMKKVVEIQNDRLEYLKSEELFEDEGLAGYLFADKTLYIGDIRYSVSFKRAIPLEDIYIAHYLFGTKPWNIYVEDEKYANILLRVYLKNLSVRKDWFQYMSKWWEIARKCEHYDMLLQNAKDFFYNKLSELTTKFSAVTSAYGQCKLLVNSNVPMSFNFDSKMLPEADNLAFFLGQYNNCYEFHKIFDVGGKWAVFRFNSLLKKDKPYVLELEAKANRGGLLLPLFLQNSLNIANIKLDIKFVKYEIEFTISDDRTYSFLFFSSSHLKLNDCVYIKSAKIKEKFN